MKNLIRTVSVEVNGKKVDIRFFEDPEIVDKCKEEGDAIVCKKYCKLFGVCEKLKDPYHLSDNNYNFVNFCTSASVGIDSMNRGFEELISLKEIKELEVIKDNHNNHNPDLYELLVEELNNKLPGKKYFTLGEVIFILSDEIYNFSYILPCYEDVEPILEDLKK